MSGPLTVYIAEAIWFEDNPVNGRKRIAVATTLDGALKAIREDKIYGDAALIATEVTDSALGSENAKTWHVHASDADPDDEGCLWITSEPVSEAS